MTAISTLADLTLRALLGRRRTLLLLLLATLPVAVALLARVGGGSSGDIEEILDTMVIRIVLPLSALVLGTSALGAELDDGTAVYILAKPIPRWQVVAAKLLVAGALTAALAVGSTVVTGFVAAGASGEGLRTTLGYAVAVGLASFAYAALFMALSVMTTRALIVGLIYTLVWEGVLASILEGTRILSVREATLALAGALGPTGTRADGGLEPGAGLVLLVIVVVAGFGVAASRLAEWEIRGAD